VPFLIRNAWLIIDSLLPYYDSTNNTVLPSYPLLLFPNTSFEIEHPPPLELHLKLKSVSKWAATAKAKRTYIPDE